MTKTTISRGFHAVDSKAISVRDFHPDSILKTVSPYYPPDRLLILRWTPGIFRYGKGDANENVGPGTNFRRCRMKNLLQNIHCVTKWSKLDTHWKGVSVDHVLDGVASNARYVMAASDGGYTWNLPLKDVLHGKAWIVWQFEGMPLAPEHGGPARLLVPHLYLWKSAKWIRSLRLLEQCRRAGRRLPAVFPRGPRELHSC